VAELRITLQRSPIGNPKDQKNTVRALGLHRMHQTVTQPDNGSIRGMVFKVRHLVVVKEAEEAGAES
jgi:large subunit ribosomal protein L30